MKIIMTKEMVQDARAYLRVCTKCPIHHYENCGTCWGFGVYSLVPGDVVRAGEAIEKKFRGGVLKCPECGSNEKGIPNT